MSRVTLENITKIFPPNTVAVDNVSLDIRDSEFFILLGPSGCGKTTTLRIIAGLEEPTKGKVYIDGEDVTDLPPKERDVAMVFQNYALYPHMRVYDNIAFPLKLRKLPKAEIKRRVKEIAELLQIKDLLNRYPKQLSGGQQQRVALARALVRNPRVWLMDEPLSNLDAKLRTIMRAEIKKLQKNLGITTIYVTHDQVEAMTMADRIAVMNKGRVLQVGTPKDIYHRPRSMFVAGFIGSPPMNFIRVIFTVIKDRYYLYNESIKLKLPDDIGEILLNRIGVDREVILGIRPEHIRIVRNEDIHGDNVAYAEVFIVEPLGAETIVNAKLGNDIIKIKISEELTFEVGTRLKLYLDPNKVYIFDPKSEELLI